jgi:hypothetical protein
MQGSWMEAGKAAGAGANWCLLDMRWVKKGGTLSLSNPGISLYIFYSFTNV